MREAAVAPETGASEMDELETFDAVILAGGRGSRMGGQDKATLILEGKRLIDRAAHASRRAGAERIVIVGPSHARASGSVVVREDPPFAGPLSAVAASLPELRSEWALLLSCDLVNPDQVVARLAQEWETLLRAGDTFDGIVLRDEQGFRQWLAGIYSVPMLRRAVVTHSSQRDGSLKDLPVKLLFTEAALRTVQVADAVTQDIDEPEDLARARAGVYAETQPSRDARHREDPTS